MRAYDIIHKKREGGALTKEEIDFLIEGFVEGSIPDYQMSALAMAICINGMDAKETFHLTDAMMRSGDTVNLERFNGLCVDKHSTGGVGDKTTLIVAPIVACLGARVAKMSGRGLGHTGGTVDKLESLTGYRTSLTGEEFLAQVEKIGIAVTGQSGNLVPADKKLYALRDVTATVDSIPLIASSIMSKKLASGAHSIVLDVKCGSGAFMKNEDDAVALAKAMVEIGEGFGRKVRALITDMSICFPKGTRARRAILKCWRPNGIPTIVRHRMAPIVTWNMAISMPPTRIHITFMMIDRQPPSFAPDWISCPKGHNARPAIFMS